MFKPPQKLLNPLIRAVEAARPALIHAIIFGFFINLLGLAGPLYMMQVYDRVITSRNILTLVALTVILALFFGVLAALEGVRSRILVRAGILFDRMINRDVFNAVHKTNLVAPSPRNVQVLRDIDTVREFSTGTGILAFCDVPWIPIYMIAATLLNPWFGVFALAGSLIVFLLALINERQSRILLERASQSAIAAQNQAITTLRNTEVIQAMGMIDTLRNLWLTHHEDHLGWQAAASSKAGPIIALTKFMRMFLQSVTLGLGAFLAIRGAITPGTMIAASIIVGRVLSPVDQIIGQWKAFSSSRQSYARLKAMFEKIPVEQEKMRLPAPLGDIDVEKVSAKIPGTERVVVGNVNLKIPRGLVVGIIGPSGAGKSSLMRVLAGVWPIMTGNVRFDGSDIRHWDPVELGTYIGYLPQDIELFSGTVAQNIARYQEDATEEQILAAAQLAGVHEMIQGLPQGYNTPLGDNGAALSGGQRQRLGLARAVFRLPPVILLDEPNSNLDFAGEASLVEAIARLRAAGRTILLITHKMNILALADKIMLMNQGQAQAFGDRDEILSAIAKANSGSAPVAGMPNALGAMKVTPVKAASASESAQ